jgi:hypothetical protein
MCRKHPRRRRDVSSRHEKTCRQLAARRHNPDAGADFLATRRLRGNNEFDYAENRGLLTQGDSTSSVPDR